MRITLLIPAMGLIAACDTVAPVAGTGFNTPEYQAQREADLAGQGLSGNPLLPPEAISQQPLSAQGEAGAVPPLNDGSAADIANQTAAALAGTSGQPTSAAPVVNNSGISDEQDFEAVSNRRSIDADASRIEQNRQTYEVVAPTAVPQRGSDGQPNIVQYALSTSNPVGTQLYSRAGFNLEAKAQRNCAQFASSDQAQIEFLANGGPQRDRKGLDPDGDGYACAWDPSPFRSAVNN
ncbi:Excalibur calcium-binding domain-containing protein [Ruegeria halocynthiae]|uniref:Excalibur calcium-binding domain-containing protein n=1 Tax=Ruegeria halocynthiae TaxID=985054 RepID=A0A1H2VEN5_9RHOB|nr:excalibur calcium-binding domain-containing protein [Ruegeria halocynthiae]SDW66778.1 Excalibur calcium-binding domain-containing protein [Ruegeria halocynthiae]